MLSIQNIVKQYAGHRALSGVSMEIEEGKIFGLLGPNGAGKTSLIRIINQITAPDSGEIIFRGERLNQSHIGRIGYLPEERGLYKKMEIGEQLVYLAQLKGLSAQEATRRARQWFVKLGIEDWWKKKIEELSKGMQQKAQFIATVLHEPELIILDEPFTGFDPVNAELIKNEILELNRNGATIIFSTHRMETVEQLCDSIALINLSHKIMEGRVSEIRSRFRSGNYLVEVEGQFTNSVSSPVFTITNRAVNNHNTVLSIKLNEGYKVNDMLAAMLPLASLVRMEELIPGMHEIFIQAVNSVNTSKN